MTWVLRVLAVLGLLALVASQLAALALGTSEQAALTALIVTAVAQDIAFAAGVVALVVMAQRARWGWFAGILVALALGVFWQALDYFGPAYFPFYRALLQATCDTSGGSCHLQTYEFVVMQAVAPVLVLLYTFLHPGRQRRVVAG